MEKVKTTYKDKGRERKRRERRGEGEVARSRRSGSGLKGTEQVRRRRPGLRLPAVAPWLPPSRSLSRPLPGSPARPRTCCSVRAGSRLRSPHQEGPARAAYALRLPSSQAASAATCAAAHSQGQRARSAGSSAGSGSRGRARRRMARRCSSSPSACSLSAVTCAAAQRSPGRVSPQPHTAGGPWPRCRGHGHMACGGASPDPKFRPAPRVCCADGAIIN